MIGRTRLSFLYSIEFLASAAATAVSMGIFYFTTHQFGWGAKRNFSLAAVQNLVYVFGALAAHAISLGIGRRNGLIAAYSLMAIATGAAAGVGSQFAVASMLVLYMFFAGACWPMLESLCSSDRDPHKLSRQLGVYNFIWASSGALMLAAAGELIERGRGLILILPCLMHGACAAMMLPLLGRGGGGDAGVAADAALKPEPELLRSRRLALWLARIAMPAMYVVTFSLSPLMPLLSVMKPHSPAAQTMIGSVWLISRMLVFVLLGATTFWHTRPRLLLGSSLLMLISFLLVTLAPSQFLSPGISHQTDLTVMIAGQIALGVAMGLIYAASLYFGMVLSDGSTEHGGYHEALVGLGGIIGPGAGVATQLLWPGNLTMAVAAVAGIVAISIVASLLQARRHPR